MFLNFLSARLQKITHFLRRQWSSGKAKKVRSGLYWVPFRKQPQHTATALYQGNRLSKSTEDKKISRKSFAVDKAHGSSRSLLFVTRMRSIRYKLGRISFLFFFIMVVANCNESCYWLHVHCSQWQLLLFFPSGIKIAFVAIWRVSCGELGYCLTRCTNPELVAKCAHILCVTSCELNERAAKPKCDAQSWTSFC